MNEMAARGRSYERVVNDDEREIAVVNGQPDIRDVQLFHFFSRSEIRFTDGSVLRLPAPVNPCMEMGLFECWQKAKANRNILPKGEVVCEGTVDSGDLVLVDRFSYHFRKPRRGEVFVFDTRGIEVYALCGRPVRRHPLYQTSLRASGRPSLDPAAARPHQRPNRL